MIILTFSLTKNMMGKEDNYRPAAIWALCTITDPAMLQAIKRYYMNQAIVDRNPAIRSTALVSITKLLSKLIKMSLKTPCDVCILIWIACKKIEDEVIKALSCNGMSLNKNFDCILGFRHLFSEMAMPFSRRRPPFSAPIPNQH